MDSIAYAEVDRGWQATAKILFGGEVGPMRDYEEWLSDINSPRAVGKDHSGKEIVLAESHYAKGSRLLSFEEVDFSKKWGPLSINELKDIDSILEAVFERVAYTGNVILGNSGFVEKSTSIIDSFYVYHAERSAHCKCLAYATQATASEHMFGCNGFGSTSFCIKINGLMYSSRCFEASKCEYTTDSCYCHGLANCSDCLFSFNLKNRRHTIGNLQLAPAKYAELRAKLVSEMRSMLVRDKKLPSLRELSAGPLQNQAELKAIAASAPARQTEAKNGRQLIEKSFVDTCKVVLGKPYGPIDRHAKWLKRSTPGLEEGKSCASGTRVLVPEYVDFHLFPRHRLVREEEAYAIGEKVCLSQEETEGLGMKNAKQMLSKIAFFCPEWTLGEVDNTIDAQINFDSSNCYNNVLNINSKFTACGFWARDSEYMFGGNELRFSSFCINCYHSEKLQRCLEVDNSRDCSDCYFCHNCENVRESMFSFNVKNKQYAIGNVEFPREKYLELKKKVLSQLNEELGSTGGIRLSILGLAARGAPK